MLNYVYDFNSQSRNLIESQTLIESQAFIIFNFHDPYSAFWNFKIFFSLFMSPLLGSYIIFLQIQCVFMIFGFSFRYYQLKSLISWT